MSIACTYCGSTTYIKKGHNVLKNGTIKKRFKCKHCKKHFFSFDQSNIQVGSFTKKPNVNTWVITSALNNSTTNKPFFESLQTYCKDKNADLLIIPIVYNPSKLNLEKIEWDKDLEPYFFDSNVYLLNNLRLMAGTAISPTAVNPLSGWDAGTKGKSIIVTSPQIMMKTVAKDHVQYPSIMYTTGCISDQTYLSTKSGEKATFNHSFAALVVEEDPAINHFHIRVLNSDENGSFYDIDRFYNGNTITINQKIPGIVLGDEHVKFIDPLVKAATFENSDSIINTLNPEVLIRHDVLDFHSASHHHTKDIFLQYHKFLTGDNNVENELIETMDYLIDTTPKDSISYLVDSNHNNHLTQWLNSVDIKKDYINQIIFHELTAMKLRAIRDNKDKDVFELWTEKNYDNTNVKFLNVNDSFKIMGIEVAMHGNYGLNSSRGSAAQFSRLGQKSITGHAHSPSIYESCYVVGHSCLRNMGYNKGPSSWHHAHCIIQPNGKRQMIFIQNGKWRR